MPSSSVTTAWSGFQASRWDGEQSVLYGQASRDRFEAEAASTRAGQELTADSAMFTAWLQAQPRPERSRIADRGNNSVDSPPTTGRRSTAWLALRPVREP